MDYRTEKFVRFQSYSSDKTSEGDYSAESALYPRKTGNVVNVVNEKFQRGMEFGSEKISRSRKSWRLFSASDFLANSLKSKKKALDPQGPFLQKWNKIFVLSCVLAFSVDPLFFYIPIINPKQKCLDLDEKMEITASVLRSFTDIFYVLHIILQFRTGFIAPSSRVFGRGVLVEDTLAIAKKYICSYFLIDILAVLPLPQVVILVLVPALKGSRTVNTKNLVKFVVFFQYIPRVVRIYPLYKEVTRSSGILTETAWAGAVFNLLLYMLASHVFGAFWYLFSIERETTCWGGACDQISGCNHGSLYCDVGQNANNSFVDTFCPVQTPNTTLFDFGIFLNALDSGWWNQQIFLKSSSFVSGGAFRILEPENKHIRLGGLLCGVYFNIRAGVICSSYRQYADLFAVNNHKVRRDESEKTGCRTVDVPSLASRDFEDRIRRYEQYRWQETRGVDEEHLLRNLPKDLRRDIKRHLCLALLMRVPMFEKMDEQLLDALCDRLKPALYTEDSYVVREGDPVDEMLFIMRGRLLTTTTNGGRTGFFNSVYLKAGDFCGEELLTWALDPHTSGNLPTSTRTVQALTEVEGFALVADDLKFVASQFRRLHSKQLRHTFRFYSQQWRTWAACFIQAAWRRYARKKLDDSLHEEENRLHDALVKGGGNSPSLGATIYASRFAANALRTLRQKGMRKPRLPERLQPILLQKPPEPDFTSEAQ
ncbi:hypothetical protein MLD38_009034 [Melastoma candidum]|uniref:Uncharacterized protein n=1 Tax=Melastoma candidum TaxID=119954 RepID=A0ACB9RVP4_9MYRT|nr:hypothetical protein MLD38_009034 [Melastoma candidum]